MIPVFDLAEPHVIRRSVCEQLRVLLRDKGYVVCNRDERLDKYKHSNGLNDALLIKLDAALRCDLVQQGDAKMTQNDLIEELDRIVRDVPENEVTPDSTLIKVLVAVERVITRLKDESVTG